MHVLDRLEEIIEELKARAAAGTLPALIEQQVMSGGGGIQFVVTDDCTRHILGVSHNNLFFSKLLPTGEPDQIDLDDKVREFVIITDKLLKEADNV